MARNVLLALELIRHFPDRVFGMDEDFTIEYAILAEVAPGKKFGRYWQFFTEKDYTIFVYEPNKYLKHWAVAFGHARKRRIKYGTFAEILDLIKDPKWRTSQGMPELKDETDD